MTASQPTKPMCPECGPHGNKGLVVLLYSSVECLTCKSKSADAAEYVTFTYESTGTGFTFPTYDQWRGAFDFVKGPKP